MNTQCREQLDDIVLNNKNLIYELTKKYDANLRDDLFQVGAMGMINAYGQYDPKMNTKFTTYAYFYINGEMKKFVRENRDIKVSRDIIYLCSQIERTRELLAQKLMRQPTISELSVFLEISEERIVEALELNCSIKSIDEPINEDGKELTIKDVVCKKENYDIVDLISLRDELSKLSPRDKEIINKRYFEGWTQSETASMMGMSQVDVSRTEKKVILSLRNKLM